MIGRKAAQCAIQGAGEIGLALVDGAFAPRRRDTCTFRSSSTVSKGMEFDPKATN